MLTTLRRGSAVFLFVSLLLFMNHAAFSADLASPTTGEKIADGNDVLAIIGDYSLTRTEVEKELENQKGVTNPQQRAKFDTKEGKKDFLKQLIEITLLEQEAKKRKILDKTELKEDIKETTTGFLAQAYIKDLVEKISVADKDIAAYYDSKKEKFSDPAKYHLHQISLPDESAANKAKKELDEGKSFQDTAKAVSTDNFKSSGGDRGFVTVNELPKDAAEALQALKPNVISAPIKSESGSYLLLKYSEKQEGSIKPLEAVTPQIKKELLEEAQKGTYYKKMEELEKEYSFKLASEGIDVLKKPEISPQEMDKTLFTIGTQTFKVLSIAPELDRIPAFIRPHLLQGEGLNDFVKQFYYRELIKKYVENNFDALFKQYPEAAKSAGRRVALRSLLDENIGNKVSLSDDEIKGYYSKNLPEFTKPEQVRAHHILVDTEEKAKALLEKINKQEKFEDLAKAESKCPSGKEGGDLGFFQKGQMVPEFDTAVQAAEIGKIVGPIKTKFGYHLIRVDERQAGGPAPLEEVKDDIRKKLMPEKQKEAFDKFIAELKKSFAIQDFSDKL